MPKPKILLFYKNADYRYLVSHAIPHLDRVRNPFIKRDQHFFQEACRTHRRTLLSVENTLKKHNVSYHKCSRECHVNYHRFDCVITVGGDGTLLEAAHHCDKQLIIGVNSAPRYSVGKLCVATQKNFENILKKILQNNRHFLYFDRLQIHSEQIPLHFHALNDILICHKNPAALSRYVICVDKKCEEQKSSGLWIATPAGSTGAILSARGKKVALHKKVLQYKPRELYRKKNHRYRLTGGMLRTGQHLKITSLMSNGRLFADGIHHSYPFVYGQTITVSLSDQPIKTMKL